jgi:uncharacterized cupredoxin-like copper-binding protein
MKAGYPLIAVLTAVAACGGDLNENAEIDSAAGEASTLRDSAVRAGNTMTAILSEWKVSAPVDTVWSGRYTFIAQNTGRLTHALEVEGNKDEVETTRIAPGGKADITVDLKPGVYELYCPIEDSNGKHKALGMSRTLVVRSRTTAGAT